MRERVKGDRKHLDTLACSYPSRGAKHRSCLWLVRRVGALQAPSRAIGDQEMLEMSSSRGAPPTEGILDSGLSARADDESRSQGRETSSIARLALSPRRRSTCKCVMSMGSRTGATGNLLSRSQVAQVTWGSPTIRRRRLLVVRLHGLPEQRGIDLSRGSCSRSYRSGRSRTNGVVGRGRAQHRETEAAYRSETRRGETPEARVIARPREGALDHQYSRCPSRDLVGRWSWPRARRHLSLR